MMNYREKTYLGDGVYASHDGHQIWLDVEGYSKLSSIALEPEVCKALAIWAHDFYAKHGQASPLQLSTPKLGDES